MRRGGAGGGSFLYLLALGAAFDAGGGEPGVEFGVVVAVEVLHHGIEAGDFLAALDESDESGLVEVDGAGGAGDVLEVEPEGVEQGLKAGGPADLADFEAVELAGDGGEVGEAADGFAAGGQVGVVFDAEGVNAVEACVAEDVAVVHLMCVHPRSSVVLFFIWAGFLPNGGTLEPAKSWAAAGFS